MVSSNQPTPHSPAVSQFRGYLLVFAACLLMPLTYLGYEGYQQLRLELYFPYRWSSEQAVGSLNDALAVRLAVEEARPVPHYSFYTASRNPISNVVDVVFSPLANTTAAPIMQGFRGYFQIDTTGNITTPLLPVSDIATLASTDLELEWSEIDKRLAIVKNMTEVLSQSGLNHPTMVTNPMLVAEKYTDRPTWLVKKPAANTANAPSLEQFSHHTLKVGAFRAHRTSDGLFIFYRSIQGDVNLLQGFVMEADTLLNMLIVDVMKAANFESAVSVRLTHGDDLISVHEYKMLPDGTREIKASTLADTRGMTLPLYSGALSYPLDNIRIEFFTGELPFGPVSMFMGSLLLAVLLIIVTGIYVIYWFGLQQIKLAEDRLNFVSAVSHELRTPLTSIRMYAEMLREKMVADEDKRNEYYDFIFFESERLSRLISNVLQLSKLSNLSRNEVPLYLEATGTDVLADMIESKVATLVEKAEFKLNIEQPGTPCLLLVDQDVFSQIAINLIDNAIKFAGGETVSKKQIDLAFVKIDEWVEFSVRDYGPGVPANQQSRIFELFYRSGSELTRTAPGTGIGLALVSELAASMGGSVDVKPASPGLRFSVRLPSR